MVNQILEILEHIESAPSAHVLVKSFVTAVPDDEVDEIYNMSEGENDQQTKLILENMSEATLQELINDLKSRDDIDDEEVTNLINLL